MTDPAGRQHRAILRDIAHRVMLERGLVPDFPPKALAELEGIRGPATRTGDQARDLRNLLWCSIDNDDSRDLDQLTVAEALPGGGTKVLVAIADVDAVVTKGTALDEHARANTTSVYTVGEIFPMLPEKLSTDLTSLNADADRMAVVIELVIAEDGSLTRSDLYAAAVRNRAKLAYNSVAAWLEGAGPMPEAIGRVSGLEANLRLQDRVAQELKALRHVHGALDLETIEARAVFEGDVLTDLEADTKNRAKDIIEDFMIAANGVSARYLAAKHLPSLRRVVRVPKRWDRIVELAAERGAKLPKDPDAKALDQFLASARAADPLRFPDLSLSVIKLLGAGEYVLELPGAGVAGHFGLAVKDYAHSTAPNRRFPDLITQRLLKAAVAGRALPYGNDELAALARHCTEAEDAAKKVERQVEKSAAAMLLESRIGERFDAIVTGASGEGHVGPGSGSRRSKDGWTAQWRGWTSASGCGCSWSAPTSSAATSTSSRRDEAYPPPSRTVEAIQVHHLVPGRHEVGDELLRRVRTSIHLGESAELGVRTEDQIDTRGGPLERARLAIAPFEHLGVVRSRLPRRAHVEQVHEEVVGQRLRPLGEDAVLGSSGVGLQDAHAAHEHRHFGRGQGQQLRLVHQQRLGRDGVAGLLEVAEAVRDRLEHGEGGRVGLLLRGVHPSRREGHLHDVPGLLGRLLDAGAPAQHDQIGQGDPLAALLRGVERLLDALQLLDAPWRAAPAG